MKLKKHLLLLLLPVLWLTAAHAQTVREVSGTVVDSTGITVPGINVKFLANKDSTVVATDMNGRFVFPTVVAKSFKLIFTGIGYETLTREYTPAPGTGPVKLPNALLKFQVNMLNTVTVTALKNPITIKQDTVEYNAGSYKVREGAVVEDVLKKLPGVAVDKDGNVEAHGKPITKIRVNGKDYFKGDVQTATQNLPADIIENIQVIDDYGDQANLTGIKTGEPTKILNITIQKGKSKSMNGTGSAGIGTEKRYAGRLSANLWRDKTQLSVIGNINNNNGNAFTFGGGGNFGRGGGGGGAAAAQAGGANGITTSRSLGFNYRDEWSKKVTVYGSYSYSSRDRSANTISTQQELYLRDTVIRNNQSNNTSGGYNHRFDFNLEYKIDTLNYLKISPDFSFAASDNLNKTDFVNTISSLDTATGLQRTDIVNGIQSSGNNTTSPSGGINALFNHKFHKRGRNFSVNTGFSFNTSENDLNTRYTTTNGGIVDSLLYQQIYSNAVTQRAYANFSYIEPLSNTTFLEFGYNYNRNNNESERRNNRVDPVTGQENYIDSLSTNYNFQFITHRVGVNLRAMHTKYNYTIGIAGQPTLLQGQFRGNPLSTHTFNWIPTARFVYNFERNRSFNFNYNGANNQPSFAQLQPQPDLSNPQNKVYGNPNLKPEFTNNLSISYNQFDMKSGNSLFANIALNQTSNSIVSNTSTKTVTDSTGRVVGIERETRYINTNGIYNAYGNYSLSKPFANRKYTVSLNGTVNYRNNISFIDNSRNISQNWVITQGAKVRVDLDSIMDTEVSANYSINSTNFSAPGFASSDAKTWVFGIDGQNYFFKHLILGYNFSQTINSGFSRTVKANPTLVSTYIEYRFLAKERAALRIQAFDMLNQNTGINRSVNGNISVDSRTNRLGRYYLLTFTLKLSKYPGGGGGGFNRGGGGGRSGGGGRRGG